MVDSFALLRAMGGIRERHVRDAAAIFLRAEDAPRRTHRRRRVWATLLAAAILLSLFGASAYAVFWNLRGSATHSMPGTGEYASLSELPRAERTVGYPIDVPDSFFNGYRFSRLRVDGRADYDENGKMLREYYEVNLFYLGPGERELMLNIAPAHHRLDAGQTQTAELRRIGETELRFRLDTNKFVPDGYVKTRDDLAAEAEGHFFVSYGAEEITETVIASVSFDRDGVRYTLLLFDADRDDLEMLGQMAGELLAGR